MRLKLGNQRKRSIAPLYIIYSRFLGNLTLLTPRNTFCACHKSKSDNSLKQMGVSFNPRNRKCLNRNFGSSGVQFASSIILYEVWVKEQLISEAKNHRVPESKKAKQSNTVCKKQSEKFAVYVILLFIQIDTVIQLSILKCQLQSLKR